MEKSEMIERIESQISLVQQKIKEKNSYINDISAAIEKFTNDKTINLNDIHVLNGALQAYGEMLNSLKSSKEN